MLEISRGIQRTAVSPHLGKGRHNYFEDVSVPTADVFRELGLEPGDFFPYEGLILQVVRAQEALTKGDILRRSFGGALRSGTVAAAPAPTKAAVKTSFNLVEGELATVSRQHPVLSFISSGTGIGQVRQVKKNTGSTDSVSPNLLTVAETYEALSFSPSGADTDSPDAWTTTPASADGIDIIVPWEVEKTAAVTDFAHGVSLGTVTAGDYTVIGIAGSFLTKCVGSVDALTLRGVLVPSATAGVAKGQTTLGITAVEAARVLGWSYSAYSGAAALRLVEWFGSFAR